MIEHNWLNLSETADILGVHPATIRAWADQGKLPARRTPGGHRRFARADVEIYALAQNRQQDTAVQLIIQNMLGRARLEMHSGGLGLEDWYQQLDDTAKREHGEIGRRLLHLVIRYLSEESGEDVLADLRQIGRDYEQLGRQHGLTLAQTTRAYLYFGDFLSEAVYDMITASGTQSSTDWGDIRRQFVFVTNEILLALIKAHEDVIGEP
jgi:excisionase family DNA binding protein